MPIRRRAVSTMAAVALAAPLFAANPASVSEQRQIQIYLTAKGTNDRLAKKEPATFAPLGQPDEDNPTIMVDPQKAFQTIEGIGGALTDASAETFAKLPAARQQELLTAYFDKEKGIGYSLCRTHINSCDFSSESYAYAPTPGDTDLQGFSVAHDQRFRIPFIKAALAAAGGGIKLFASPWSPPAWMKTNGDMLKGGKLKAEYRDAWARYFVRFVEEYQKQGIPLWGLTVQNEPMATQTWESCVFTGEEERDFVRDHLGPVLEKAELARLRLMVWDHNRGIMYQRAKAVLDDPAVARYVWGTAFHWYTGDHWDNVRMVHDAFPEKQLLFTEGCVYPFDWKRVKDWQYGEQYGEAILRDLNNWAAGWTDWNVLLDQTGGPNHLGNFCFAPVHGDTRTGQLHYMSSYYYLGHFSKFVRPGAKRVACTSNQDDLLASAFRNPDGQLAVVVLNRTGKEMGFRLWIDGQAAPVKSPAHSIVTLLY
jgi:glucosylceramidase